MLDLDRWVLWNRWLPEVEVAAAILTTSSLMVAVFTLVTLAEAGAPHTCLEALTVPLDTLRLLTVASLRVLSSHVD